MRPTKTPLISLVVAKPQINLAPALIRATQRDAECGERSGAIRVR